MSRIRIGNAQAFWGDRPSAARELLAQEPGLDYLTMDYLAEVSMSILALQRERDPQKGYPQDFVEVVRGLAAYWASGGTCKLIANAGGLNPLACARACKAALEKSGCRELKIAVVSGDDVVAILAERSEDPSFNNLDTDQSLALVKNRLVTANAYVGCQGIVAALNAGADIVITGRVADPSMVAGACAHHFGWSSDAWDCMAGATVAGHLLECGTHATGGISTDWLQVPDPIHIGFPIAEVASDGSSVITKSDRSGGRVTESTVKEQLLYEIGDPNRYISPDVIVSILGIDVRQVSINRVSVRGAKGAPPPKSLKVSATYRDGYRAAGMLTIVGPQAVRKAKRCGEIVLARLAEAGWRYRDSIVESLGNGASVPVLESENKDHDSYETVLRISVEAEAKEPIEAFAKEMIPLVSAGPQGTTGYAEGRPSVHAVFRYWPCLIASDLVPQNLDFMNSLDTRIADQPTPSWPAASYNVLACDSLDAGIDISHASKIVGSRSVDPKIRRLHHVAYGRSGDKGVNANIGILARDPRDYESLKHWLTTDRVQHFFKGMGITRVERYEVPNLGGLNFILYGILKRSIRNDAQGKALAQALLSMPVDDTLQID